MSLRRSGFESLHGRFTLGMWCKMSCTSRNEGHGSVHARSKSMRRSSNLTFPNRGILSIGKTSQSICPVLARMTDTLTSVLLEHKVREADCRAHNPEVRGSNPPPATPSNRKEKKEMRSTVLTRKMNQIQIIRCELCIQKNRILCDVLVRLSGLCEM